MRFVYPIDLSEQEEDELLQVRAAIARWWREFEVRTADLTALFKRQSDWDLVAWMSEWLESISPNLFWEFGPGLMGGNRLVITCESHYNLRPLVSQILSQAPRIEGWEFYGYRLAEDYAMAIKTVEARGGGLLDQVRFRLTLNDVNQIEVESLVKKKYPADKQQVTAFVALETLLGEEVMNRWIGSISHRVVTIFPFGSVTGSDLLGKFRVLLEKQKAMLPNQPWHEESDDQKWSVFEMKPNTSAEDFFFRDDQYTQVSAYTAMHKCVVNQMSFDSIRYSKYGEVFCFLKIDGIGGLPEWGFKDRGDIQDAVEAVLRPARLGAVVGGGTGHRYSYIDLALTNVVDAAPLIREALQRGGIPTRTWLLFMDEELANEWIGICPNTPPPPMPAEASESAEE
jgi:hypothetical protein